MKGCLIVGLIGIVFMVIIGSLLPPIDESEISSDEATETQKFVEESEDKKREKRIKQILEGFSRKEKKLFKELEPISANELIIEYKNNEFAADSKYKNKYLIIYGYISDMGTVLGVHSLDLQQIIDPLDISVSCQVKNKEILKLEQLKKQELIFVLGKVEGMMLNMSINLFDCVIMFHEDYEELHN